MFTPLFKNKFKPPVLMTDYLPRERLLTLLEGDLSRRLTCLVAGTGYGKSTLAAGFIRHTGASSLWINLDEGDSDDVGFLRLILRGLAEKLPSFHNALQHEKVLHQIHWPARGRLLEAISGILEKQLADQPLLLILDDYHNVAHSEKVKELLDSMLRLFPAPIHFIIISRNTIQLKTLPRLAAAGRALKLGQEELKLTAAEVEIFFAKNLGLLVDKTLTEHIWHELSGWPLGIKLAGQTLKGYNGGSDEFIEMLRRGRGQLYLFEEMMNEIIADEPEEIREILFRTAIFPELDEGLLNSFFQRRDGVRMFNYFIGRGLPVERMPGGIRYHKLFKDYLLNRLKENHEEYLHINNMAAEYFLARERPTEAFPYLLAAGKYSRAALVLQQHAPELIRQNYLYTVTKWLEAMPRDLADAFPEILLHTGEACVRAGRYREGVEWLRRAAGAFGRIGDAYGLTCALCAQGGAFAERGAYEKAMAVYQQALMEIEAGDPRLYGIVVHYLAVWVSRVGEIENARRYFNDAINYCHRSGDVAREAGVLLDYVNYCVFRRGFFQEAMSLLGRAAMLAESAGESALIARCCSMRGTVSLFLGKCEEAEKYFKLARQSSNQGLKITLVGAVSRIGEALSLCARPVPDYPSAEGLCNEAADELRQIEPSLEAVYLLAHGRSNIFRYRGEIDLALEEAQNALELAKGMNDCWLVSAARLNLAAAKIWAGGESLPAGVELIRNSIKEFSHLEDNYHQAVANLWLFFGLFNLTGNAGDNLLQDCLKHLDNYPALSRREKGLTGFIKQVNNEEKGLALAEGITDAVISPSTLRHRETETQPRLRIYCLGGFRIYRGGELLEDKRWTRRKSKTLLKFLTLHLRHKVPKEVIMELLWPDLPEDKASNAFYVTLHALRKILNRGLPRDTEYVANRGGFIYLEPNLVEGTDVEDFNKICARALGEIETSPDKAVVRLEEACRIYQGDLLNEDIYENWLEPIRERLRQQYLNVMTIRAEIAAKDGRPSEALELWQQLVECEPFNETAQKEIMRILLSLGQRSAARRQFISYSRRLKEEVGEEPGEEIMQLYQQVASGR